MLHAPVVILIGVQRGLKVVAPEGRELVVAAGRKDAHDLELHVQPGERDDAAELELVPDRILYLSDNRTKVLQAAIADDDAVAGPLQSLHGLSHLLLLGRGPIVGAI